MIQFKKAVIEDIEDVVNLRIQFMCEVNNTNEYDPRLSQELYDYLKENMINENFISWIAKDGNRVVGTSGICFYTLPPTLKNLTGKTAYIMNMYTLKEYRGQGIGYELFNKMIEEARIRNCGLIYLHATENGRRLYEKFGFVMKNDEMIYVVK